MTPMIGQQFLGELSRNPDFGLAVRKLDPARHHADDGTLLVVQRNLSSDDLRIAAKPSQPEAMTQNRHMRRAGNIILRPKIAAQSRAYAQEGKKIRRDLFSVELFRRSVSREIEVAAIRERSDIFEDLVSRFPVREISGRGRVLGESVGRSLFPNHHESARIAIWERTHKDGIGNAKDGRICCDSQGENGDGEKCKTRALAKHTKTIAYVFNEIFDVIRTVRVAAIFLDLLDAAEFAHGSATGLLRGHSRGQIFFDLALEVKTHFRAKFPFDGTPAKQRAEPVRKVLE